jgi:hypothetical protein
MIFPPEPSMLENLLPARPKFGYGFSRCRDFLFCQTICCGLVVFMWASVTALAQSSFPSQQSSSPSLMASGQQPATQPQPPAQAKPAAPDQPPQKEDSLAEAARKAKEKKTTPAKGKVYTEDDLSGMKGTGVSVVGETPKTGTRRPRTTYPSGGGNDEEYWRGMARQLLDAITQTDQQIAEKKEEIKKFGNGGFDVQSGRQNNIAYINDRNGQLKSLEGRKADLQSQLDDLREEGRKAGAPPSWFR